MQFSDSGNAAFAQVQPLDASEENAESRGLQASSQSNGEDRASQQIQTVEMQEPAGSQQNNTNIHNADFWDPNVLASTNWLDTLEGYDFDSIPFPNTLLPANGAHPVSVSGGLAGWNSPPTPSHNGHGPFSNSHRVVAVQRAISTSTPAGSSVLVEVSMHDQDSPESGQFYIDGGPARLPRTKRRKLSSVPTVERRETTKSFSLAHSEPPDITSSDLITIDTKSHSKLLNWYERVCLSSQGIWSVFERVEFPSASVLNHMVHLYLQNFDQILPFMHRATLSRSDTDPVLALAMAAIGSFYLPDEYITASFTPSMFELVRRITLCQEESGQEDSDSRDMARVRLLLTAGLLYSGQKGHRKAGSGHAHLLKEIHQAAKDNFNQLDVADGHSKEYRWLAWCQREAALRLAHSAWLVDCMTQFHFGVQPSLRRSDACIPLPCPEDLWAAPTAQQWEDIQAARPTEDKSLPDALAELYIDKRLPRGRGEFARVVMIHGLFHHFWEVESYHLNPMSTWEPTAERQSSANMLPRDGLWLPGIQNFTRWQNSSMDALDILHWQANATIGQASGLEHSTVLHLHLARIVLLVPYAQILSFAKACGTGNRETPDADIIRRWAVQHQYKARLAVVHAGVVFWHVRRYSIDAFYEAPAVGLATMTLWAFSTFAAQPMKPSSPASVDSDGSEADLCNIILLDRPTDDELVQQFIRHDKPFQAHLTGVGDLYSTKGPQRILLQGRKLLSTLRCWGVSASWLALLQGVSGAYSS